MLYDSSRRPVVSRIGYSASSASNGPRASTTENGAGGPTSGSCPEALVQDRRARVALVGAGPLQAAVLLEARVAHPGMHRRERAQLVPDLLGDRLRPVVPEPARELGDDPHVVARLARRVERLADALHPALAVRHRAVGLAPRRRRGEDDIRHLGRPRQHDVLHDEEVELREELAGLGDVGLGLGRVLADHVEGAQLAALHAVEHLRQVPAVLGPDRRAPGRLEAGARLVVALDVLEAGELVRDRAHVAAALDVVLAAQRVEPRAEPPDVAAEQGQVDQREDVVDGVVVLRDPERPADHAAVGARERVRRLADHLGGNAGQPLALGERERLHRGRVVVVALGRVVDEGAVREAGVDDLARHRVRERDVGADVEPEPAVGPLRRGRAARIDDEEPGAVVDALEQVVEEDRVRLARVRAPEQDHVGLLDLCVGRRSAACSEHRRQTDDARSVSGSVTGVDVVRAHHLTGELLRQEVHLVRRLGAREDPERLRGVGLARTGKAGCGTVERLGPARGPQHAAVADERRRQP